MNLGDLCKLVDVKNWMSIQASLTAEDALLARLISATSNDFLQATKRSDLTPAADYTELRSGNGKQEMFLYHWPINSVASVTIDDVAIDPSPDGGISDGWWLETNPDPEQRMKLNLTGSCFTMRTRNRLFGLGAFSGWNPYNVKVVYNAGYADVAVTDELATIPPTPGPYTVTVAGATTFAADTHVKYSVAGTLLAKVSGVPTVGQYAVDANTGIYTFAAADQAVTVKISYTTSGIPSDIQQAMIDWIAYRYKGRQWIGQSSKHMNTGETVSFLNWVMPVTTRAVIDRYMSPLFRDRI